MKKKTYQKMMGAAAVFLCSGCLAISAMADNPKASAPYEEGPVSNLWMSVVELPSQARVSVTVPVSYGFAVVGSVDSSANGAVKSSDGTVLLSNVRVQVTKPSSGNGLADGEYTITTVGLPQVPLRNYSTDERGEAADGSNPVREGIPVEIKPYVTETPETLIGSVVKLHHWKPIETDPTGDTALFKRYRMGLDGKWFDTPGKITAGNKVLDAYFLGGKLSLEAPPDVPVNGWNAGGTAKVPYVGYFDVDVQVGGVQNQYNQVEQSVKVGQIGWEIIPGKLPGTAAP